MANKKNPHGMPLIPLPDALRAYYQKQGAIGGKQAARNMTAEQRKERARIASAARMRKKPAKAATRKRKPTTRKKKT